MNNNQNNDLPTSEEYRESHPMPTYRFRQFSDPMYQCPKCGGGMCRNEMVMLTSYPAQYEYVCNKCGFKEAQWQ
jgi:predicted RNA-binding Zn-ribbon protein involved in translation (DUF1610 family)